MLKHIPYSPIPVNIFQKWFAVVWGGLRWFGLVCGGLGWFAVVCGNSTLPFSNYPNVRMSEVLNLLYDSMLSKLELYYGNCTKLKHLTFVPF